MATPTEPERGETVDTTVTERDQESRLKRYDQRVEEWLTSLKEEAEQRSPEVLSALSAKAKDVADYLDRLAEKARSRSEPLGDAGDAVDPSRSGLGVPADSNPVEPERGYGGPNPESDPKGDGSDEDQGT
jgi:hypothetical protein